MNRYIIYALLCPKCGCPRYVGKSSSGLSRVKHHLKTLEAWDGDKNWDGSRHKIYWVKSLHNEGLIPNYVVLTTLPTQEYLDEAEIFWIAEMKRRRCPLTNITAGGAGTYGWKQSPETIAKRAAHFRGVPKSPETKRKIAESLRGRPSPKKGRPLSPAELEVHARVRAIPPFRDQHGRVYRTLKEAAERWELSPGNICAVLKGRRKSAGGLEFRYLADSLSPTPSTSTSSLK